MSYGETLVLATELSKVFPSDAGSKRRYLRHQFFQALGLTSRTKPTRLRNALDNVSLSLARGQALGIIGSNGAGKSTLLKLIQGSLRPDGGEITVFGKVGGLIELTSGFQENLSGMDNISIKARQIGMQDAELNELIPDIVEFSGLEHRLAEPIRNYSTGMKARLGFSIATHLPYDIMLCDEALSVGDARFQQKCLAKVTSLKRERVFILVSHSMSHIRRFCDGVLVLDEGRSVFSGDVEKGIRHYEDSILKLGAQEDGGGQDLSSIYEPLLVDNDKVRSWNADLVQTEHDGMALRLDFELVGVDTNSVNFVVGVPILDQQGQMVTGFSHENVSSAKKRDDVFKLQVDLAVPRLGLNPGNYTVIAALQVGVDKFFRQIVGTLRIEPWSNAWWGIYTPEHRFELEISSQKSRT